MKEFFISNDHNNTQLNEDMKFITKAQKFLIQISQTMQKIFFDSNRTYYYYCCNIISRIVIPGFVLMYLFMTIQLFILISYSLLICIKYYDKRKLEKLQKSIIKKLKKLIRFEYKKSKTLHKNYFYYENQRWFFAGFSNQTLIFERPNLSDYFGSFFIQQQDFYLEPNWTWQSEWLFINNSKTDENGWTYGKKFQNANSNKKRPLDSVRKRKFFRQLIKKKQLN